MGVNKVDPLTDGDIRCATLSEFEKELRKRQDRAIVFLHGGTQDDNVQGHEVHIGEETGLWGDVSSIFSILGQLLHEAKNVFHNICARHFHAHAFCLYV